MKYTNAEQEKTVDNYQEQIITYTNAEQEKTVDNYEEQIT